MTRHMSLQRFTWNNPGDTGQHTDLGGEAGREKLPEDLGQGCGWPCLDALMVQWAWGREGGGAAESFSSQDLSLGWVGLSLPH